MTDANKVSNPEHCGRDPADPAEIQIRINLAIRIQLPDNFWLKFWHWRRFVLSEHVISSLVQLRFTDADTELQKEDSLLLWIPLQISYKNKITEQEIGERTAVIQLSNRIQKMCVWNGMELCKKT